MGLSINILENSGVLHPPDLRDMTPSSCSYPGSSTRQCYPHFRLVMALIPYVTAHPRIAATPCTPALTPPTIPITCRHARMITLRAGWESLNQIWLMQHFSSDKR